MARFGKRTAVIAAIIYLPRLPGQRRERNKADNLGGMGRDSQHDHVGRLVTLEHRTKMKNREYCGFCGKHEKEVDRLIDGPETAICNECIVLLHGMLAKPSRRDSISLDE